VGVFYANNMNGKIRSQKIINIMISNE